ncbi:hypothetical protein DAPPUDRAFT_341705 [Daphnia pulex]|uniref:Uncharacterized protein n=1 Tax=Daphnia pulex TaxID=6669 RepID=E9I5J0_DAPPU|nr:hypothetical protein DAPPUDRAFT_341705 [Daphnia pulex]|eukprot:EFX60740.1 hypothetical protein DAPPUDRAFT_341705 [Daphnia pulex]
MLNHSMPDLSSECLVIQLIWSCSFAHLSVVYGLGGISAFYSCHPRYHWSIPFVIHTHFV